MSTANLANDSQNYFSESFLNYLNTGLNQGDKTYCEEKSNKYHDSSYIWCKVCDKIFCTQCSMNHLINNQINHCPTEKVFLRKEHFDVEFVRDFEKLKELRNRIIIFLKERKPECNLNKINALKECLQEITNISKELYNIIPKFIKKYYDALEKIQKSIKNMKENNLNENALKIKCQELVDNFKNIGEKYTHNKKFEPNMLKPYYDELITSYRDIQSLNELFINNCTSNNNSNNIDTYKEYEKINSNLTTAFKLFNTFKKDLNFHLTN